MRGKPFGLVVVSGLFGPRLRRAGDGSSRELVHYRARLIEANRLAEPWRRKFWLGDSGQARVIEAIYDADREAISWDVARAVAKMG